MGKLSEGYSIWGEYLAGPVLAWVACWAPMDKGLGHQHGAKGPKEPRGLRDAGQGRGNHPVSSLRAAQVVRLTSDQVKAVSSSLPPGCRKMRVGLGFWQKLLKPEGG